MDYQQKVSSRPSGIPRLASRIPLPTKSPSRSPGTSPSRDKLQADPGLDAARLRRPTEDPVFKKPLPKTLSVPTSQESLHNGRSVPQIGTSDYDGMGSELALDETPDPETNDIVDDVESRGRPRGGRTSLSERTVETISQIPPSPASSRRQSSFFNPASPIRSPSRAPSSATAYSRSPSRSSRQQSGSDLFSQSPSTSRLPSRSRISAAPAFSGNGLPADHSSPADVDSPSKLKTPSARQHPGTSTLSSSSAAAPSRDTKPGTGLFSGAKGTAANKPKVGPFSGKKPVKPAGPETSHEQRSLNIKKTRKAPPNSPQSSTDSGKPSVTPSAPQQQANAEAKSPSKSPSKSSSALRDSIAKAKAARRAANQNPQVGSGDPWENADDPFNQKPKDSGKGLLRKRVEGARASGHLNIAAMSLKEMPEEVMTMYDFDPNSSTDWYETVDLVKFIAADNDLAELPDSAFPDIDLDNSDADADEKGNQFGGLELLDLHGNVLRSVPIGLRKLKQLHTLNLSNNELGMDDIEVVTEVESLRDLKLANNRLDGVFTPNVGRLRDLQVLDLHGNSLTHLPETVAELPSLKVLNVGQNQLTSLPFESLSKLSLREIIAPKNKLERTLIPESVHVLEALKILDVAGNALDKLSEDEDIELPNLQILSINANRIQRLPSVSPWKALLTLSAEDNSLAELPHGFTELKSVRNVDFTGNDLSKLDEKIGLMESLVTFRIANNPLRERKFLGMNTEDLLNDLRNRCEPDPQDTDEEEGSVGTQFTLAPESPTQKPTWQVKPGGVLDRSHSNMKELEMGSLEQINPQDVRCLYLQHNELRHIPPAISMLADKLVDLDLSRNPLDGSSLLSSSITMPNLQRLNLSSAGLSTLDTLLANLLAPSLSHLDISFNRLSGPLPAARKSYPSLTTLLVGTNQITSLDFDSVQGLQVLDVSNNDIDTLPAKVGLLRADGFSENWGGGSALRRLDVAGNRFRVPRWQIVEKGTDAVLTWLKDRIPTEELCEWEPDDGVDTF
ncbi:conserved leucine-rich repeat protein [Aspergillus sp. HF37]|nr:conserved leucine-rich repeat protein [Aspergillus sp. HF37]